MKAETIEFLPQLIKDVVIELEEREGLPPEMSLPTMLGIANFATQSLGDVNPQIHTWSKSPTGQYYCVLAESGQRKSATYNMLIEGVKKWQERQVLQAKQDASEYKIAEKKYEADIRERAKDATGTLPPVIEPAMYRNWKHLLEKFTLNGLLKDLERIPHAFLVNTDAAEFFNSHAFQGKNGTDTEIVSALSKLWSNEPITKSTGEEEKYISDRRATALFMLQAGQAKFLKDARYKDQGFTNRILVAQPPVIKRRIVSLLEQQNEKPILSVPAFNKHIEHLLDTSVQQSRSALANMQQELANAIDPHTVKPSAINPTKDALEIFDNMFQTFEIAKADKFYKHEGVYEEHETFINRCYEHFIRMAATIALFQEHTEITLEDSLCARAIIFWFIEQRLNLELDLARDKNEIVIVAEDLYKRLKKWQEYPDQAPKLAQRDMQEKGGFSKTCLNNNSISSYKNMTDYERTQVLNEMHSRDWVELINLDKGGVAIKVCDDHKIKNKSTLRESVA